MNYIKLGNTGLKVSRLCFGGLIIGPLQANLSIDEGARIIASAFEMGVNFIDTAELYGTYAHIKEAIRIAKIKPVIASKSYAYSNESARDSVEKARREMDVDVLDIFMLHEQESKLTLRGHRDALDYYLEQKQKGIIKAVGVSTHNVEVVEAAANMPEIDVIHPLVNMTGLGIGDGTIEEMLAAVEKAYNAGKGIYSMKPLGGGNLIKSYEDCMDFVLKIPFIHSIALGMQSIEEVKMNISVFKGEDVSENIRYALINKKRILHIDYWCNGCGCCVKRCGQGALKVANGKAEVDMDKCVLCGYCSSVCSMFAIKIR
ncbi:aldo/keto reductase [Pseudobacteroides cellulosolvens]|uniref:NADP-dependent oxidoreductase domain containing protein n=1 Tax=Pseudobacteroides cellulosolvens ATCC 35603 = DSM 2933 TaxID=398512 RepID=A0A0L6JRQ6_9FIRM|nr:aldo/keto reductase [Pseudobacteroides cellulosolvens]KNY28468.1 NADP-dependent oxidoreductase domain containing protein [Pseudobacteroides cellulosolvens ATCC 35603 = DSM 2933]